MVYAQFMRGGGGGGGSALVWLMWTSTVRAPYSTGVNAALLVNHRVGLSLESQILKIRSRVNDRHSLWGKL